jgi:hypothetical protein
MKAFTLHIRFWMAKDKGTRTEPEFALGKMSLPGFGDKP